MTNSFDTSLRAVGPGKSGERGVALIMTLMLLSLLMAMLMGYFTLTQTGLATAEANMDSVDGLYAAEAGLNIRADQVRLISRAIRDRRAAAPQVPCPAVAATRAQAIWPAPISRCSGQRPRPMSWRSRATPR